MPHRLARSWECQLPSNHDNEVKQPRGDREGPKVISGWLAQLVARNNNPNRALEQFQKLNPTSLQKGNKSATS